MSTLTQLNTYSNSQIPFEDDRSLIITTSSTSVPTTAVTIVEDTPVNLSAFGVTFSQLRSLDNATADNITLEFDFSAATNPGVVWPTKDAYVEGNTKYNNITFSNPSVGVFRAADIQLNTDYLAVLANTEIVARDQIAVYSYTITVSWPGNSYTQQFDVTTTPAAETNLNGLALTARALGGHLLFDPSLDPRPAIIDASPASEYDLEITSNAGATLSIGAGTPTATINLTGDKDTVNAALQTVYYYPLNSSWDTTDTLNYSLTVTNGTGGPYVSETGSFTNYIPVFASIGGIVSTTTNSSREVDLFSAPYPTVTGNITSSLIDIDITTTYGEIKQSAGSGTWGNSLRLTGNLASLETQLQSVQYRPDIDPANPTKLDTLNYVMTYAAFTLDSGAWSKTTTIDTLVANMLGGTVSDVGVADLFSAPLPTVTSTDDNTAYDLTWNYGPSLATISPNLNGSTSTIQTGLQAATFKPLVQDTAVVVDWTLALEGVVWQTGSFTKTIEEFFRIDNVPATITLPDQRDGDLFYTPPVPLVVDNTTGTNSLTMNMLISGTATPGVFNAQTTPTTGTVTYTGSASSINTEIAATTYNPHDYLTATTEALGYTLTVGGIDWVTNSSNIEVPPEIEMFNFNTRSYIGNSVNNDIFLPAGSSPYLDDNADPTRTLRLSITATTGSRLKGGTNPVFPYGQVIVIDGDAATINAALASTTNPIGLIPSIDSNGITLTFEVTINNGFTTLATQTISFNKTSDATLATSIYTSNFTITEDQYFYGSMSALLVSAGGGAGQATGPIPTDNTNWADSGQGGHGVVVKFEDYLLDNIPFDELNFVLDVGIGGLHGTNPGDNGAIGGNSILSTGSTPGVASTALYTAYGGGGGGGSFSYRSTSLGSPSYARTVNLANGSGGSGGASIWINDDDPANPYDEQAVALGATAGVGYVSHTGQTPTGTAIVNGIDGRVIIQSGPPTRLPRGGVSPPPNFADDITGTPAFYSATGGSPDSYTFSSHDGDDGEIIVRIEAR